MSHAPHSAGRRPGHEQSDARARPIVLFGAGLALFVAAVFLVLAWGFDALKAHFDREAAQPHPLALEPNPVGPRLQATPERTRREHEAALNARLARYGWIDRESGVVHVPIERALELVAAEGLPQRQSPPAQAEPPR